MRWAVQFHTINLSCFSIRCRIRAISENRIAYAQFITGLTAYERTRFNAVFFLEIFENICYNILKINLYMKGCFI